MGRQKSKQTSKKTTKIIGVRRYTDHETGEVVDADVILSEQETDINFEKLFLQHFLSTVDMLGSQKMRFCFFLIDHKNYQNVITMNYRQMAEKSGISLDTVNRTMKVLLKSDFLQRINTGAYRINPNILCHGKSSKRRLLVIDYRATEEENCSTQNLKPDSVTSDNLKESEENSNGKIHN